MSGINNLPSTSQGARSASGDKFCVDCKKNVDVGYPNTKDGRIFWRCPTHHNIKIDADRRIAQEKEKMKKELEEQRKIFEKQQSEFEKQRKKFEEGEKKYEEHEILNGIREKLEREGGVNMELTMTEIKDSNKGTAYYRIGHKNWLRGTDDEKKLNVVVELGYKFNEAKEKLLANREVRMLCMVANDKKTAAIVDFV